MARRPLSLTLRLSLLFGVAAMLVLSAFGWLVEMSIREHFETEDRNELKVVADAVETALLAGSPMPHHDATRRFDDILVGHHGVWLSITNDEGGVIYNSSPRGLPGLDAIPLAREGDGDVREWNDGQHAYRVLFREVQAGPAAGSIYRVSVAVPIDHHLRFLARFRHTLWAMVATGVLLVGLLGWIAVRRGHAPLRKVVDQIHRISANELHTRLAPESVPVELRDLAESFNEMMARMEAAFTRLANFSADIAHDLRTPVTSMMTQTQVALSQPRSVEEYQEILYSSIEEYEHMAQMINDMLFLARADNGLDMNEVHDVDLAAEVAAVRDYYEAWLEERGIELAIHGAAVARGDATMLRRVVSNLLSNAIHYTPAGGHIRITLAEGDDGHVCLTVENDGPAIAAEHLPRLFDRFYRVDPARHEGGSGLGLAIVKSIVEAHGGYITVESREGLTRFTVSLPAGEAGGA